MSDSDCVWVPLNSEQHVDNNVRCGNWSTAAAWSVTLYAYNKVGLSVPCAGLSWPYRQLLSACKSYNRPM